jgi:hypothetical protein
MQRVAKHLTRAARVAIPNGVGELLRCALHDVLSYSTSTLAPR